MPIGALIGAISGQIEGRQQRSHGRKMADQSYRENKKMAEYQHSKDLEMWNRSNKYNTPTEQMQRLKDGGLNPNLVYGKGIENTASGALPKYQAPTADYSGVPSGARNVMGDMGDGLNRYLDLKIKAENLKGVVEDVKMKKSQRGALAYQKRITGQRAGEDPLDYLINGQHKFTIGYYQTQAAQADLELKEQAIINAKIQSVLGGKDIKYYGVGKAAQILGGAGSKAIGMRKFKK